MARRKAPEITFQEHIAGFLVREHGYGMLEQSEITDPDYALAEDHLWAFLQDTQAEAIAKLAEDYGNDSRDEIFKALKDELRRSPLWLIIRNGLTVRGIGFKLFYSKPRSDQSVATALYERNRITFRHHFYFGAKNEEIDFVAYLNGLPIITIELKHEQNQTVHDAVSQYAARDHNERIFQLPFLHIAADTSDVMVATDPRREENFRWFNTGLANEPMTKGEYPVEYLYREVLSKERLLESLSFFLVHVPKRDAAADRPAQPEFSLFPRYHQSRMVRKVADAALQNFVDTGTIGRKFLINHSAGSGKTLSICWLADRLHSLYKPGTNYKLVDMVVILTDRKSLDKNIRDEIENFSHLKNIVGLARKAEDLPRFLKNRMPIIVSTQQKFAWILEQLEKDPSLKERRVAFLIDEAHRSQEGQMGAAIRVPFRKPDEADAEDARDNGEDEEEKIARIIREHDNNQLFVAFTATPAPITVTLFGAPFDTYSEAEAIEEGYIVDVATSILSFKTLYNLNCPILPKKEEEKLYPKGVISKALKNVAYQDDGLIQYKAEVMLRIFEERVSPLINGRSKAMIVATSRVAGLRYYEIIKEKLKERGAHYKVLYAFSDFTHPETNEAISEHKVNDLGTGELIEDRFEGDDYRLMVVANKFQTGFDQPLLAGMFLDKAVIDRNAVQTVSRLNRCYDGKNDVIVVDFTNNADAILKAFAKYRKGTPFEPGDPDEKQCTKLLEEIFAAAVYTQKEVTEFAQLAKTGTDAQIQYAVSNLRTRFQEKIVDIEQRKAFVYLLARYVKSYHFLTCFFTYPPPYAEMATFAEIVGPQLIKMGTVSDMMKLVRATTVVKASVQDQGEVVWKGGKRKGPSSTGQKGGGVPLVKVSISDMIAEIRKSFAITEEEALYIKEVTEEKVADDVIKTTVLNHRNDRPYLEDIYRLQLNKFIQDAYDERGRYDELTNPNYIDTGAIFDIMAMTVIQNHLHV
ncbi:putative type I restriction enzyme HindVIIP R protein [Geobacter sp. OR-1]|uniref:DEAD/DEAH box helicase family protein n=1 Tax=Geobacter sp. OR-1 TaxID=1266765 RepID=UPI0005419CC3|nr:DEAD/DEAH box helicase family protein [Geobacter sp. OR-1]GAM11755.1 putative type I restriction enzyme HindVIIP R protein [Geobacter sp. OR-1]